MMKKIIEVDFVGRRLANEFLERDKAVGLESVPNPSGIGNKSFSFYESELFLVSLKNSQVKFETVSFSENSAMFIQTDERVYQNGSALTFKQWVVEEGEDVVFDDPYSAQTTVILKGGPVRIIPDYWVIKKV